jgi:hypothetical protein
MTVRARRPARNRFDFSKERKNIWRRGFEKLRLPKLFDLLADPFERGHSSILYHQWFVHHAYMNYGAVALVAEWLQSFKEFPPR